MNTHHWTTVCIWSPLMTDHYISSLLKMGPPYLITTDGWTTISHRCWWLVYCILLLLILCYSSDFPSVSFFICLSFLLVMKIQKHLQIHIAKPKFMRNFENIEYISAFLNVKIYLIICCLCGIVTNKSDHGARLQQKQKLCQ